MTFTPIPAPAETISFAPPTFALLWLRRTFPSLSVERARLILELARIGDAQ